MSVQISAHGFQLTEALRESCEFETNDRLKTIARHNFSAKWILTLDGGNHSAKLHWNDGQFHGDLTHSSEDMYITISHCAKKAAEQIKKAHEKRYDHHHIPLKKAVGDGTEE